MKARLLALPLVVAAFGSQASGAAAQDHAGSRVLVMPFDDIQRDGRIFWMGEAASILLADDLNARGANAITRQERERAFERLQVPPAARLTDATVIRLGQLLGADAVVVGSIQLEGDTLIAHARDVSLDTGRVRANVTERGALQDLYSIFDRIATRLAPKPDGAAIGDVARPPVSAFENYIKGLLAETPDTAIDYLETALKLQPSYDRVRLALWDVYTDQGEYDEALAAVSRVPKGSPYVRRARFLAGLSLLDLKRHDEAFASFKALEDEKADPTVLNNLGVVQLRRPVTPQTGRAVFYFNKAREADPDDPDYAFNLGYAYWLDRDPQAAIYWLREVVRRNPADGEAHYVLGTALASAGSSAEAAREKELAHRLSSEFIQWDKRPAGDTVPRGLERIKSDVELPHDDRIESKLLDAEQRDQTELAKFYLDSARRDVERENDREAMADLNRALYLSPYLAEAHLLLGRVHLRNGQIREAIDAFKISIWSAETAAAHAALGEAYRQSNDLDAARAEAERALVLDSSSREAKELMTRLGGR